MSNGVTLKHKAGCGAEWKETYLSLSGMKFIAMFTDALRNGVTKFNFNVRDTLCVAVRRFTDFTSPPFDILEI
jgi:hypothetical protein